MLKREDCDVLKREDCHVFFLLPWDSTPTGDLLEQDVTTENMPLLTPSHTSYREHALAYPQPHILQRTCPCLPPATKLRHVVVLRLSPLPQF